MKWFESEECGTIHCEKSYVEPEAKCPRQPSIVKVVDFLSKLFKSGLQYSTLNTYKSTTCRSTSEC